MQNEIRALSVPFETFFCATAKQNLALFAGIDKIEYLKVIEVAEFLIKIEDNEAEQTMLR